MRSSPAAMAVSGARPRRHPRMRWPALFELLLERFGPARKRRAELLADPAQVDAILAGGAARARALARATVDRARRACGLG